ncbi:MAG: hypothetical protein WD342_01235 [Verrucomicrobiales bacterium]
MTPERKLRVLTPAQKLAAASDLYWSARALKASALRNLHPDWSEDRVQKEVRQCFLLSASLNR